MNYVTRLLRRAKSSAFSLWLLNLVLSYVIPFNKPHGFRVDDIQDEHVCVSLPHRKQNLNHINGIHACALATVAEFTTGLYLLQHLDAGKYRLILQTLELEYTYQCKTAAKATFAKDMNWLQTQVIEPLERGEAISVNAPISVFDSDDNEVCRANVCWQLKPWSAVQTPV